MRITSAAGLGPSLIKPPPRSSACGGQPTAAPPSRRPISAAGAHSDPLSAPHAGTLASVTLAPVTLAPVAEGPSPTVDSLSLPENGGPRTSAASPASRGTRCWGPPSNWAMSDSRYSQPEPATSSRERPSAPKLADASLPVRGRGVIGRAGDLGEPATGCRGRGLGLRCGEARSPALRGLGRRLPHRLRGKSHVMRLAWRATPKMTGGCPSCVAPATPSDSSSQPVVGSPGTGPAGPPVSHSSG